MINRRRFALHCLALCLLTFVAFYSRAQNPALIPQPVSQEPGQGAFELTPSTGLYLSQPAKLQGMATYINQRIFQSGENKFPTATATSKQSIRLVLNEKRDDNLGREGYRLRVSKEQVEIAANDAQGIFYGIQTLLQLLPPEVDAVSKKSGATWSVPATEITDYPRFAWRGIMLDVSRHFFSKEYVKEFIEQIARYKYNRLHLHLTDDNGWRLEIKSLPKLTTVGAWRVPRVGTFGSHEPPKKGEKATYGGFYTQEDMKEIIAFAKERFIEILPEIDVPGHSMAALAAYPELCVTKDSTISVNPGSKFSTWFGNGKFEMHIDNTLNPTDEKVYEFLDKVVTEVATLFPFEYIHMGGDECYKGYWERDPKVQAFMKKNNIKNGHDLQAYFTDRVNKIVKSKGKKMIGWDEIIEGELSRDAAVMSWQGTKGGIEASKRGHTVVMSPAPHYYLDMGQGEPSIEPPIYNTARLKETYLFNIVPPEADPNFIIGGQGNLWTEQIPTTAQVEYMLYPRAFAIAETLWSPNNRKDWNDFVNRTEQHFTRLDAGHINYAVSMYDPIITVSKNSKGNLVVDMATEVGNLDLFYTLDNTIPNPHYSKFSGPIELPRDVDNFRVVSYRGNKQMGRLISLKTEDLVKRIRKK